MKKLLKKAYTRSGIIKLLLTSGIKKLLFTPALERRSDGRGADGVERTRRATWSSCVSGISRPSPNLDVGTSRSEPTTARASGSGGGCGAGVVGACRATWSSGALAYGVRGAPSAGTTSEHNPSAQAECDAGSTAFSFGAGGGGSESAGGGVSSIF
jgi:hypothetical protein